MKLYTIGYSGFQEEADFLEELKKCKAEVLVDVRSSPHSSHHPNYNKEVLSKSLESVGIQYLSCSRGFGARQPDKSFYKSGRFDFELFSRSNQFLEGVTLVEQIHKVTVLMCAETHPMDCHRAIMVARAFSQRGHEIVHLMPGNKTMTQDDLEEELLKKYFPNRQDSQTELNNSCRRELLHQAYILQNDEIGYRWECMK